MDLKDFRLRLKKKFQNIPEFIDCTNSTHYLIWNAGVCNINDELMKLVTDRFLTEKQIFNVYCEISSLLDDMVSISSIELQNDVLKYYLKSLLFIKNKSLEFELYETTSNIKKFSDIYFNSAAMVLS